MSDTELEAASPPLCLEQAIRDKYCCPGSWSEDGKAEGDGLKETALRYKPGMYDLVAKGLTAGKVCCW